MASSRRKKGNDNKRQCSSSDNLDSEEDRDTMQRNRNPSKGKASSAIPGETFLADFYQVVDEAETKALGLLKERVDQALENDSQMQAFILSTLATSMPWSEANSDPDPQDHLGNAPFQAIATSLIASSKAIIEDFRQLCQELVVQNTQGIREEWKEGSTELATLFESQSKTTKTQAYALLHKIGPSGNEQEDATAMAPGAGKLWAGHAPPCDSAETIMTRTIVNGAWATLARDVEKGARRMVRHLDED